MKLSKEIEALINEQINDELYSSNQYLAMASYFIDEELKGFGNFFQIQAEEERFHAMKHFKYLHDVGGRLRFRTLEAPVQEFSSYREVFEITLKHEEKVTQKIYDLTDKALQAKDFATYNFLEWFVAEQVEEESLIRTVLKKLDMIGDNSSALYLLDEELSKRTLVLPPLDSAK